MKKTLKQISKLYSNGLGKFGISPESVGWKDEFSHKLRFKKLLYVIDEDSKNFGVSVNDLGCGWGALYSYMKDISKIKISHYYGYDISEKMLKTAKECIKSKNALFIRSDCILHEADYSFVSGIFNVKFEATETLWAEYLKKILKNLNENSKKGFAFNALSNYVDFKKNHLYYADPLYFFDFCKKNFSKKVSLLHDYELFEWTITVRK